MKKQKRVPCPHCRELILPKAKKCRFCGEKLSRIPSEKNEDIFRKPISIKKLYWTWIVSIGIFFLSIFFARRNSVLDSSFWPYILMLFAVVSGTCVYLALVFQIVKSLKKSEGKWYGLAMVATFFLFFAFLFNYDSIEASLGFDPPAVQNSVTETAPAHKPPAISPSPELTPSQALPKTTNNTETNSGNNGSVECIGPDQKIFNTTMEECKNLNEKWGKSVNYMVDCHFPDACGGGTKHIAKSECDIPCTPTTGSNNFVPNNAGNSGSANYYCYDNFNDYWYYTTSGEQCNANNLRSGCLSLAKSIYYEPCMDSCLQDAHDVDAYCIYDLPDSQQDVCLAENDKTHQSCMDACGVTYTAEQKKCY